jgi:hypothetical protein
MLNADLHVGLWGNADTHGSDSIYCDQSGRLGCGMGKMYPDHFSPSDASSSFRAPLWRL